TKSESVSSGYTSQEKIYGRLRLCVEISTLKSSRVKKVTQAVSDSSILFSVHSRSEFNWTSNQLIIMKKYISAYQLMLMMSMLVGCNDDFMDRYPKDSIVEENFWNSETELTQYINSFYPNTEAFSGHNTAHTLSWLISSDYQSDNLVPVNYNQVAAGEHVVPASGGGWNWQYIRRRNYFLTRYQQPPNATAIRDAKAAEVRVFKAWEYFKLVKRFGYVPWLSRDLNTDSEELYKPRDSRTLVMDSVLNDLNWAIAPLATPT